MARRKRHEEHTNHEAWAIPYGDLITLLLAFFVVMYALSSVNEGKYRVLSDSLTAAFRGTPRTLEPVQVGEKQVGSGADIKMSLVHQEMLQGQPRSMPEPVPLALEKPVPNGTAHQVPVSPSEAAARELARVAEEVERAMHELIAADLVAVRRHEQWIEVEIRTDILFPSGVATLSSSAVPIMKQLADKLRAFPNPIRVEGHTDDRPISTAAFPSNWELSSARAATVVHLLARGGVDPQRLAVVGLGEYRPARANDTPGGRNANRRVVLVILGGELAPEGEYGRERGRGEPILPDANVTASTTRVDRAGH